MIMHSEGERGGMVACILRSNIKLHDMVSPLALRLYNPSLHAHNKALRTLYMVKLHLFEIFVARLPIVVCMLYICTTMCIEIAT